MKYYFILGNNPALSVAEIRALYPENEGFLANATCFFMESEAEIDADKLIRRLGGTIKFGIIKEEIANLSSDLEDAVVKTINTSGNLRPEGKFNFGFSAYGLKFNFQKIGLTIKKEIKEGGFNARLVTSREQNLSSVIIEQNHLIKKGAEIVIIKCNDGKMFVGQTLAVQAFKELSFRDYGRPSRDDYSGMLPPKLAQIMINLAKAAPDATILDAFCGSGTIISEALLMGYEHLIGSDISEKAVEDTRNNLEWISEKFNRPLKNVSVFECSATTLSEELAPKSVDAIVSEPYLGPQRGQNNIGQIINQLEQLYSESISEFSKILKDDGHIVMIWPVFNVGNRFQTMSPRLSNFKIVAPLAKNELRLTDRQTIIYGREGQKVWREIVILEKK
ncbi:MAG: methyltransferase domain-containing protein [Candidatus Falkowbacteria bacterium]